MGTAALTTFIIGVTALPSRASLRSVVVGKEATVLAFRVGVDDPGGTLTGGPSGSVVTDAFRWMQRRKLGPWAPGGMVDDARFTFPVAENSPTCRGGVESVELVGGGFRLRGWLAPPGNERASSYLAVLYGDGSPAGIGVVGTYRPDVKATGAATSDWTGFVAYAHGSPPAPLRVVLVAGDRRTPVCRLEALSGG